MKRFIFLLIYSTVAIAYAYSQPYSSVNLYNQKPKPYENRTLRSEKTEDGKLSRIRRFFQNGFTHYNFYFNANNKINDVIAFAKERFKDDYTQLLPFYNYSLDVTSTQTVDLDSIIYKCNAGILLHDLRNDWIDNMYLVLGKCFLLRKQFDSAAHVFQYINHSFGPNDEGFLLPIASNSGNTNGIFTVATKERKNKIRHFFFTPPSRNEALLWQVRNYLEEEKVYKAAALLADIRVDTFFPKRLQPQIHEMAAYMYYKEKKFDSAAWHLERALSNADNRQEAARWKYLCGQLYQRSGHDSAAIHMFEKSIQATNNPLLEIYARLNIVSISNSKKKTAIEDNLADLYKMAKREKYETNRDVIYHTIAILESRLKNTDEAVAALTKSLKWNADNPSLRQSTYLLMADVNYQSSNFIQSAAYYDSVKLDQLTDEKDKNRCSIRKPVLKLIANNLVTIHTEDSLQQLAALSDEERIAYVKKLSKILRKAQGLKEEAIDTDLNDNKSFNPFTNQNTQFYFNNTSLVQKGLSEFKAKWGNRPNVDNWRRQSALDAQLKNSSQAMAPPDVNDMDVPPPVNAANKENTPTETSSVKVKDISFEGLMSNIPLTKESKAKSDTLIMEALLQNGILFQNELQNYPQAISSYEQLLKKFRKNPYNDQIAYNLRFCYLRTGNKSKAAHFEDVLREGFSQSKFTKMLIGQDTPDSIFSMYQSAYNALQDSGDIYTVRQYTNLSPNLKKGNWTPQLIYLDAITYVKERMYATAGERLRLIMDSFPTSPIADKAKIMLRTLYNRESIEDHLTYSTEEKMIDSAEARVNLTPTDVLIDKSANNISATSISRDALMSNKLTINPNNIAPKPAEKQFEYNKDHQYYVAVIFKANEEAFNEAKNAINRYNKEKYYNQTIDLVTHTFNADNKWLLLGTFENAAEAMEYHDKLKLQAPASIMAWIPQNRYRFSIISSNNLQLLKENNNTNGYFQFLKTIFADKF